MIWCSGYWSLLMQGKTRWRRDGWWRHILPLLWHFSREGLIGHIITWRISATVWNEVCLWFCRWRMMWWRYSCWSHMWRFSRELRTRQFITRPWREERACYFAESFHLISVHPRSLSKKLMSAAIRSRRQHLAYGAWQKDPRTFRGSGCQDLDTMWREERKIAVNVVNMLSSSDDIYESMVSIQFWESGFDSRR